MNEPQCSNPKDRLQACGVSICLSYGAFPDEVLNGKGHLSIQTSGYDEIDLSKALPVLHDLDETFELEFLGPASDDDLRHLAGLRNLLSLNLSHQPFSDVGVRHLANLPNLRVLALRGLPITSAGIRHLGDFTNLTELHLCHTQVDDRGLEALAELSRLTVLDLASCPVTDRSLESVARMTRLQHLYLGVTKVQGTGLPLLERLTELENLHLDGLPITDREASSLSRLVKLRTLSLRGTQVGDAGAPWLSDMPRLQSLSLSETRIGDEGVRRLRGCPDLTSLRLDKTAVTGHGLAELPASLEFLSLTEVKLRDDDLDGICRLKKLSTLFLDASVVSEAVAERLRRMHLAGRPAYEENEIAFSRLPDCPLCREVIEEDSPVFVPRPFHVGDEFWQYAEMAIHWDCFARWEKRPEFAQRYFQANAEATGHNEFWGLAYRDEQCFVSVNPSQYVREVQVMLAETGSDFRVKLSDWQDWLEGEWFEGCRHEVEREALGRMIPLFREKFPTAEAVVEAAGFSPEEPRADPGGIVGQISYEFACEDLARRAAEKGQACPHCGEFSNDYEFRKVEMVDPDGPRSVLICQSCKKEFGPDDV